MHANAPPLGLQPMDGTISNFQKIGVVCLCSGLLYAVDLMPSMLSDKTYRSFLLFAAFLFLIYAAMWVYTATYLSKRNLKWFEENEKFLYAATFIGVLGSAAWVIGMWPVYHFFALPLWIVIVILVTNLNGISFRKPNKIKTM